MIRKVLAPVFLCIFFFLQSCSLINSKTTLWTDNPIIAAYVETYNSQSSSNKIEIIYKENPAFSFYNEKKKADIVIGKHLNSPEIINNFSNLNTLFWNKDFKKTLFYKGMLHTGASGKTQRLIPVSFDIPALLYKKTEGSPLVKSFNLNLKDVIELSKTFNDANNNSRMAFSPRWDAETLYNTAKLMGTSYRASRKNLLIWDDNALRNSVNFIREWILSTNKGFEEENKFTNKYLYDPGYKLIDSKRILFYQSTLTDFFNIPENKRNQIDFKWLSYNDYIPVNDGILFIGINKKSFNQKESRNFIKWLVNEDSQKKLLELSRLKRIRSFGIANGFSSLKNFNQTELVKFYPLLLGHLPNEQLLLYPEKMPIDWLKIKESIIIPWLNTYCSNQEKIEPLENKIQIYQKQRY